jgi:sugar phosphate isomerase/epimerase
LTDSSTNRLADDPGHPLHGGTNDQHLLPCERRTIDWPRATHALNRIGYTGPLNMEVSGCPEEGRLDQATTTLLGMLGMK